MSGCTSLKNIIIPENVTYINNEVFRGCENLQEITIPKSVTGIGSDVFKDCTHEGFTIKVEGKTKAEDFYSLSSTWNVIKSEWNEATSTYDYTYAPVEYLG